MRDDTPMPKPAKPAIDAHAWSSLESIADGDASFLVTVIEQYLGDSRVLVDSLGPALEARDAEALERASHTLKGASANLGAMELARAAESLCSRARDGVTDEAAGLVSQIEVAYAAARTELELRVRKLRGAS